MLTVKKAVAQTTTNLSDLKTLTSDSQKALSELATQKPEFVQAYQKRVAQLSDQEAAVAKIASLFDDPDFKEQKAGHVTHLEHGYTSTIYDAGYRLAFDYRPNPRHQFRFVSDYTMHLLRP